MHKLYEYACGELKELEKKADKGLSSAELEYANKLTELKKNILKIEMLEGDSEYSEDYPNYNRMGGNMYGHSYRGSYGRGRYAKRDSMGRYSRDDYSMAADDVIHQLEDMMETAPDERSRKKIRELISEMKNV